MIFFSYTTMKQKRIQLTNTTVRFSQQTTQPNVFSTLYYVKDDIKPTNMTLDNNKSIYKPMIDDREISHFTLPNNLRVIVISDQKTPTSIATLSFASGSYEDPDD